MTKQRESKLSSKIMASLRTRGIFCYKVWGNEMQLAGLPDIICCVRGWFLGLETKMPESRNKVSPRQEHVHGQIREAGGTVYIVTSVNEANKVVDDFMSTQGLV